MDIRYLKDLEEGYVTYTGHVLTAAEAAAINQHTQELRDAVAHKKPNWVIETMRDRRHWLFTVIAQEM